MTHARRLAMGIVLVTAGAATTACALRQNLRNQFLSYRGAWHCGGKPCAQRGMTRSTKGSRAGEVDITTVKMNPRVAMVVNAGATPESFSAKMACGAGAGEPVPDKRIFVPGSHKISGQADSYVVLVEPEDYSFGDCSNYRLHAHATWENGKREYNLEAGLSVK